MYISINFCSAIVQALKKYIKMLEGNKRNDYFVDSAGIPMSSDISLPIAADLSVGRAFRDFELNFI